MPKPFYKHKTLLDENLYHRRLYPLLNEHFDVKHIRDDLRLGALPDLEIYQLAVSQGRIILTKNVKDFRPLLREDSPGRPGMSETVISGKVALLDHITKTSGRRKLAVPKPITDEIRWHIDCGTAYVTGFQAFEMANHRVTRVEPQT